jgi:hypothetical protein
MTRMIESFEDAVGCYFSADNIYWKVIHHSNGSFKYQYCNKDGEIYGDIFFNWSPNLDGLNSRYDHRLNRSSKDDKSIPPIIWKIRKMEARFNQRTASV